MTSGIESLLPCAPEAVDGGVDGMADSSNFGTELERRRSFSGVVGFISDRLKSPLLKTELDLDSSISFVICIMLCVKNDLETISLKKADM